MILQYYQGFTTFFFALFFELVTLGILPATAKSQYTEQQRSPLWQEEFIVQRRRRARLRFKVPNIRSSGNLEGGIARGSCHLDEGTTKIQIKALLPNTNIGLTTAKKPVFFFQISSISAQEAKFILLNAKGDTILYKKTFLLTQTGGVMSFTLPDDADALEVGKEYSWELVILCDPDDQMGNPRIQGSIKRVQPSQKLASDLAKLPLRDRANLYASEGFWYDTLAILAELRLANPNDSTLAIEWQELLDSVGLSVIDREPLLECCISQKKERVKIK